MGGIAVIEENEFDAAKFMGSVSSFSLFSATEVVAADLEEIFFENVDRTVEATEGKTENDDAA